VAKSLPVPLLVCALGDTTGTAHRKTLGAAGIPVFDAPEQAVRGFLHLVMDRRNRAAARELPPSAVLSLQPDREAVRLLFDTVRATGRLALAPEEVFAALAAYGLPVVPSRTAQTPAAAAEAASLLGYPAVVKLCRDDPHADPGRGGLALDLHDADEVRQAARAVLARQATGGGGVGTPSVLVQPQVPRGRKLMIRVTEDVTFGPVIAFGQGGTAARIMRDLAMDLPPLNLPLARALIARTRSGALLGEFRDQAAADIEAVAEALVRISQLVVDFPEIAEIVVNPLFADQDGVMAADAWLRLRDTADTRLRLVIAPYPAELAETFTAGEEALTIRPIRPEDAEQHSPFFRRLPQEDVRFRFFSAIRELPAEQIARLTQVDYDREMAFVAVRANGDTVGVARLVCEADRSAGEFAVVIQPDMKGRGLASRLMRRLIDWGRAQGLGEIVGQVLADNVPMLAFIRHLGFEAHRIPDEPDVVEVRLRLAPPAG
jgi:acetyltransferase